MRGRPPWCRSPRTPRRPLARGSASGDGAGSIRSGRRRRRSRPPQATDDERSGARGAAIRGRVRMRSLVLPLMTCDRLAGRGAPGSCGPPEDRRFRYPAPSAALVPTLPRLVRWLLPPRVPLGRSRCRWTMPVPSVRGTCRDVRVPPMASASVRGWPRRHVRVAHRVLTPSDHCGHDHRAMPVSVGHGHPARHEHNAPQRARRRHPRHAVGRDRRRTDSPPPTPEQKYRFTGYGTDHGVGLSQRGAAGRAKAGQTYDQILQHYFDNVRLGHRVPEDTTIRALVVKGYRAAPARRPSSRAATSALSETRWQTASIARCRAGRSIRPGVGDQTFPYSGRLVLIGRGASGCLGPGGPGRARRRRSCASPTPTPA